ncbi:MAG: fluoride efflux transporter CrcB [Desulforhopalus sp.]
MVKILAIAVGGGIGSIARYTVAVCAEKLTPMNFPLGTLSANLIGCLMIGFFWSYFDRIHISNEFRLFLFTGFLGGFTTFSTFARETEQFFKAGEPLHAITYLLLSNILGITMVAAGFFICHRFIR